MNRVLILIDGFNLYHALDVNPSYHRYKWLNLEKFSKCFIEPKDSIVDIFYFTAYVTWDPPKLARHQIYVSALRTVNVKVVLGVFRNIDQTCRICNKTYQTFREKKVPLEQRSVLNCRLRSACQQEKTGRFYG